MSPEEEKEITRIKKVAKRYFDAYRVAKTIDGFGSIIKAIGIIFALLLVLIGVFAYSQSRGESVVVAVSILSIILGISIGGLFFVVGVLVSAQGQVLKASLDTAVNTSPFLLSDEKATVMSV